MIKNKITRRGSADRADMNITLWNKTFENGSTTGSIWMYVDSSSTAEDVNIAFEVWSVQTFLAYGDGVTITTKSHFDEVPALKTEWNVRPVRKRRWG